MKIGNIECYGIIYKIKNKINGKVYIGQTKSCRGFNGRYCANGTGVERVYNYYLNNLGSGKSNIHLIRSIAKYGIESFEVNEFLDIAFSKQELDIKEKCWISVYNTLDPRYGYNKRDGGQDGGQTYESRKLNSISKLGFDISKYSDDIIDMYINKKEPITHISNKYNVNDCVIDRILKENNIKKRSESEVMLGYDINDYKDYIIDKYKNNSINSIAKELNVTINTIKRVVINNNIKIKSMSEIKKGQGKGSKNPSSTTIFVYNINKELINKFGTRRECAEWLKENNIIKTIRSGESAIDRSIQYNRPYKNKYYFKKIKNNI